MKKILLAALVVLGAMVSVSHGKNTIDGSSQDALKKSIDRIADELERDHRKDFNEAVIVWYIKAIHSAAMDYKEDHGRPPEDEDLDDAAIFLIAAGYLDGMAEQEVIEEAHAIDEDELIQELEDMGLSHPLDLRMDLGGLIRMFGFFF
ncbi:DUF6694 family lipoprotein [Desulfonatronospira sp.]|uniref:DUF6694 family lipoprotein n=1 Tax=Desulfonatronospira sp. TaxID=1962951 RepID=UPI0025B9BD04|nr:DUF6694 family lipoprotein [Desulfonatronospira sp.]